MGSPDIPQHTYLFHGDQCSRCPDARRGQPARAAMLGVGLCWPCWLGCGEEARRVAAIHAELVEIPATLQVLWAGRLLRSSAEVARLEAML